MGAPGGTGPPSASPSPMTGSPELDGNLNGQGLSGSASSSNAGGMRAWMDLPIEEPLEHHGRPSSNRLPSTTAGASNSGYHSDWADVVSPSQNPRRFSVPPAINANTAAFPPLPPARPTSSPSSITSQGTTSRSPPARGESKLRQVISTANASDDSDDTEIPSNVISQEVWLQPGEGGDSTPAAGDKTPRISTFRISPTRTGTPPAQPRSASRSSTSQHSPDSDDDEMAPNGFIPPRATPVSLPR
jgi:hypothetical protein